LDLSDQKRVFKGTGKKKLTDIGFWFGFSFGNRIFYKNLLFGFSGFLDLD